jgi:hypothetical protein
VLAEQLEPVGEVLEQTGEAHVHRAAAVHEAAEHLALEPD